MQSRRALFIGSSPALFSAGDRPAARTLRQRSRGKARYGLLAVVSRRRRHDLAVARLCWRGRGDRERGRDGRAGDDEGNALVRTVQPGRQRTAADPEWRRSGPRRPRHGSAAAACRPSQPAHRQAGADGRGLARRDGRRRQPALPDGAPAQGVGGWPRWGAVHHHPVRTRLLLRGADLPRRIARRGPDPGDHQSAGSPGARRPRRRARGRRRSARPRAAADGRRTWRRRQDETGYRRRLAIRERLPGRRLADRPRAAVRPVADRQHRRGGARPRAQRHGAVSVDPRLGPRRAPAVADPRQLRAPGWRGGRAGGRAVAGRSRLDAAGHEFRRACASTASASTGSTRSPCRHPTQATSRPTGPSPCSPSGR